MRHKLRYAPQASEKSYAAATLLAALGERSEEDCLYMLSDSDPTIRGMANGQIAKFHMTNLTVCLPSLLWSEEKSEHWVALKRIRAWCQDRGLPY